MDKYRSIYIDGRCAKNCPHITHNLPVYHSTCNIDANIERQAPKARHRGTKTTNESGENNPPQQAHQQHISLAFSLPVVRGDDRVLLALGDVAAVPLANARAAGVSEHHGAGIAENLGNVVALDGGADLLRAGRHGELALQLQALVCKAQK